MTVTMSKITSKGQTTIPKEIRDHFGLKAGDRVAFIRRGNELVLHPVKGTLLDLRGSVRPRKRPEDLKEAHREVKRRAAERMARD